MNNQKEIFKDVIGYEGLYQVSNFGNVISLNTLKYKSISDNGTGYKKVNLWKYNKGKNLYVHRLVVESFISSIPKDMQVNHINGIKEDNRLDNLEIVTRSENIKHAFRTGLSKSQIGNYIATNKSGYSNISIKQDKGKSYFVVCIRMFGKRFERRFKELFDAVVIHNQYMREIGRSDLIHNL
jgi:hypothetical protein